MTKTQFIKEKKKEALIMYENASNPEDRIEAYIYGALSEWEIARFYEKIMRKAIGLLGDKENDIMCEWAQRQAEKAAKKRQEISKKAEKFITENKQYVL